MDSPLSRQRGPESEAEREGTGSPRLAQAPANTRPDVRRGGWLLLAAALPLLTILLLPLLALLLKTPPSILGHYLASPATVQAVVLSLSTSSVTTVLVTAFGTPLAYLLARRRFRLQGLLDVLLDLPTVLPPAVAGLALLMAFGRQGLLGGLLSSVGIEVAFTPLAVVMAQTFVAAPYYIKTAAVGLGAVSNELEQAGALDGASPAQVFRYILAPLAWRGIAGGAALCWARALGEFGATIIFAGNYPGRTQTMPLAVYLGFEIDLYQALTLAALLLLLSFTLLIAIRALLRRAPETRT